VRELSGITRARDQSRGLDMAERHLRSPPAARRRHRQQPPERKVAMTMTRSRVSAWVIGLITAGLFSALAQAQETSRVRFILDWAFQGQQAVFTIPLDDGTYQHYNLNVTVDRGVGSGDTVTKVASGAYDIGLADIYSMVRFNGQNPDHQLIAVMAVHDKSALAVETKSNSGIRVPADLNGKTIASPLGDASRQLFPLFADVNKLDQNSIKWINVSPELREPMLLRGDAQAITGHITTVMMNMRAINVPESEMLVMPYANYGIELYGHVLVVNPAFAEKNPETVRNFIRATVHGINVMIKDPDVAVASVKKRDPLLKDDVEKSRIKMSIDYMFMSPNVEKNGFSNVDMARLDRTLKQAAKAFEIKTVPTAAQVYTDRYLPPRSEMMITK
jgi:NitT/TauT family transport system substrate-binding protein